MHKLVLVVIILGLVASPARGQQQPCAPYEVVAAGLARPNVAEEPVVEFDSDSQPGVRIVIFASPTMGGVTVVAVREGVACLVATGINLRQAAKGQGS